MPLTADRTYVPLERSGPPTIAIIGAINSRDVAIVTGNSAAPVLAKDSLVGMAAGVLTFVWPGITALALVWFIAAWAVVTGVLEIAAAFRLRRMAPCTQRRSEPCFWRPRLRISRRRRRGNRVGPWRVRCGDWRHPRDAWYSAAVSFHRHLLDLQRISNMKQKPTLADRLERFSTWVSQAAGSTSAFIASLLVVLGWAIVGPLFKYSDTWQLVINTITNVVAFVMVFLIQRAQNKDGLALQIKLSELLAATKGSTDPMVAIDQLSEAELRRLHARYLDLVRHGDRPAPNVLEATSSQTSHS
jgi:low affinity Fe/Cu permease